MHGAKITHSSIAMASFLHSGEKHFMEFVCLPEKYTVLLTLTIRTRGIQKVMHPTSLRTNKL